MDRQIPRLAQSQHVGAPEKSWPSRAPRPGSASRRGFRLCSLIRCPPVRSHYPHLRSRAQDLGLDQVHLAATRRRTAGPLKTTFWPIRITGIRRGRTETGRRSHGACARTSRTPRGVWTPPRRHGRRRAPGWYDTFGLVIRISQHGTAGPFRAIRGSSTMRRKVPLPEGAGRYEECDAAGSDLCGVGRA